MRLLYLEHVCACIQGAAWRHRVPRRLQPWLQNLLKRVDGAAGAGAVADVARGTERWRLALCMGRLPLVATTGFNLHRLRLL